MSTATTITRSPSPIEAERIAYRSRQRRKSTAISIASTLIFAAIIVTVLLLSPGWQQVREAFFDAQTFKTTLPSIVAGLWLNIKVLCFAVLGVAVLGTALAVISTLRNPVFTPLRLIATAYVDLIRGVPVLLVLYLVGYGIPALKLFGRMPPEFWGTIAIIICYCAYVAEVLRSGIEAVHPSQRIAARSLGLTHNQTVRLVVMPQAVRKVTPALMNDFVSMQKDVGLISVLGAVDAIRAAQIEVAQVYNFTPYLVAGLLFIAISYPFLRLTDWLNKRAQKREQIGGLV